VALELLGIEIGDFVAIAALIASMFTFIFGYVRTKNFEQIKTATDCMDRIDLRRQELLEYVFKDKDLYRVPNNISEMSEDDITERQRGQVAAIAQYATRIYNQIKAIWYFIYLVTYHQIKDKTIKSYHAETILDTLTKTRNFCMVLRNWLKSDEAFDYFSRIHGPGESYTKEHCKTLMEYEEDISRCEAFWLSKRERSGRLSRLKKVFHVDSLTPG
jgi:hypothetical protein